MFVYASPRANPVLLLRYVMAHFLDPPSEQCSNNCGRPATTWMSASVTSAVHGDKRAMCAICVATIHLEHAKQQVARIPEIEEQLAKAIDDYERNTSTENSST